MDEILIKDSEIDKLQSCKNLALELNKLYSAYGVESGVNYKQLHHLKKTKEIFLNLNEIIIKLDFFYRVSPALHSQLLEDFEYKIKNINENYFPTLNFRDLTNEIMIELKNFCVELSELITLTQGFRNKCQLLVGNIDELFEEIELSGQGGGSKELREDINKKKKVNIVNGGMGRLSSGVVLSSNSEVTSLSKNLKEYENFFSNHKEKFLDEQKEILGNYTKDLTDSFNELKTKSLEKFQEYNSEVDASKLKFKNQVDDEISLFKEKFEEVNKDFKNSVKDFEVLKKFINAKGEQEITDHYKNKAKWERVTYWLMTFVTFGIIIFSVCMAINGLDEYKEKANISVETLLEKYKEQPVEKIEKIYGAVQSSALTYLVLRLIFSVLLFSSIIYTSRVAYRAYVHMRHSENMMLKLATLRPFINQLDESERNQIHKDLVPDYFGKDAGLVDGASEKFKDLPANVSAVAMKAIEQIGGSTGTSNAKSPDPKEAKTAGE